MILLFHITFNANITDILWHNGLFSVARSILGVRGYFCGVKGEKIGISGIIFNNLIDNLLDNPRAKCDINTSIPAAPLLCMRNSAGFLFMGA